MNGENPHERSRAFYRRKQELARVGIKADVRTFLLRLGLNIELQAITPEHIADGLAVLPGGRGKTEDKVLLDAIRITAAVNLLHEAVVILKGRGPDVDGGTGAQAGGVEPGGEASGG